MRSTARRTDALRGPKKAVTYVGATAALLGAGTAGAARVLFGCARACRCGEPRSGCARVLSALTRPPRRLWPRRWRTARHAVTHAASGCAGQEGCARQGGRQGAPPRALRRSAKVAPAKAAGRAVPRKAAPAKWLRRPSRPRRPSRLPGQESRRRALHRPSRPRPPARCRRSRLRRKAESWSQIQQTVARQTGLE